MMCSADRAKGTHQRPFFLSCQKHVGPKLSRADENQLDHETTIRPLLGGGLNRSPQHFILEGKDGVWDGTEIS